MEEFLSTLEKTWYDKVQWSAEDDDTSSGGRDWTGPVKIAILDTGIDLEHEDFLKPARRRTKIGLKAAKRIPEKTQRERIKACRNFVGDSTEDVTDETGHGTHIAGLILSIAPRAELYIAKTSSGQEALEKHEVENSASKKGRRESRRPIENVSHTYRIFRHPVYDVLTIPAGSSLGNRSERPYHQLIIGLPPGELL